MMISTEALPIRGKMILFGFVVAQIIAVISCEPGRGTHQSIINHVHNFKKSNINFLLEPFIHFQGLSYSYFRDQLFAWSANNSIGHSHRASRATNLHGRPMPSLSGSWAIGTRGEVLMQDFILIEKLATFNRERIPERVVHAKGAGAHGYFEVTHDISQYTKAKFLNGIGKRTPLMVRFSTVGGELGTPDTALDPHGFVSYTLK